MKKRLTSSQREVLKFLSRGHHIYIDERGKFMMSKVKKDDGTYEAAIAGHSHTRTSVHARKVGAHMYRPTIETLLDSHLLTGVFDENQRPTWVLNKDNEEYANDLKELIIESALGITRKAGIK